MWFLNMLMLIFGLFALMKGADILVQKSAVLAKHFSVSPFFVGVVLLGMGTSAPEMAVSAFSSFKGLSHLAVANVFGSNIFNILLVLGMILFQPLSMEKVRNIRTDIWFLVLTGFSLGPMMGDLFLSRLEAFILTLLFFGYMTLCYFQYGRRDKTKNIASDTSKNLGDSQYSQPNTTSFKSAEQTISAKEELSFGWTSFSIYILVGTGLLAGGSKLTVMGAEGLGQSFGVSERILGLLVVSAGTSLPEFMASLTAILKGHKDMAVGNIIGSNVFNTFAVLSLTVWIRPATLDMKMWAVDLPALWLTHLLLLGLVFGYRHKWVQKTLPYAFLTGYMLFLLALFLKA